MKIRRILATAVAAAVTTPVVLLSAAPAFADTKPAPAQTQEQKQKPTIEQLKLAVAAAQNAYDAAVVAYDDSQKAIDALDKPDHPLQVALAAAKTAAATADGEKTAADQAVVDAQAKLDGATTDEEKAAAQTALDEAKRKAEAAATAKTTADGNLAGANKAVENERVALLRKTGEALTAKEEAKTALDAAKKALADAEKEAEEPGEEPGEEPPHEDCAPEPAFTSVVQGLPEKVVAGTTVDFTLRLTNGTDRQMDEAYVFAAVHAFDEKGLKPLDRYLDLEWSTAANPEWVDVPVAEELFVGALKAKSSVDVKLRLKVDADTPAGQGVTFVAGDFWNEDESCGGTPDLTEYEFDILAKGSDPGKVDDATGKPGGTHTTTPVTNTTTHGVLAATGSSDAVPQIALAGGAALVLGAGAMVVARRRRADADG
ncbi:peptidase [Streptomyces sp. ISL-36]|uniref:peptidase n=1 Tax=Streptomyces sp. ISL-36 TaxID=2819182 RepID=UPI001BEB357D|nr:peptidase [Streptomyces sp. ISL-36]MBT2444414.1 peptidase [Streptomyces sp. ISL-36]